MADEALTRIGTNLEELSARFELAVEAVSGLGARLERLKEEVFGQFAEVGSQIRFLSEQIAENRATLATLQSDFGAEMVRLGETLGRTRVELREQLSSAETALGREIGAQADATRASIERGAADGQAAARKWSEQSVGAATAEIRSGFAASGENVDRAMAAAMRQLKQEIASGAESIAKKLGAELKQTGKALEALSRKFERFDDRVTIQVRDQEQRLKKLEGRSRR